MKAPWQGKSGLAKATSILATMLLVSAGLCGANFFAVIGSASWTSPATRPGGTSPLPSLGYLLVIAGYVELAVIAFSIVGLLVVAVVAIVRRVLGDSE